METQWLEHLHHPSGHDFELHFFSTDTAFYLTLFLEGKKVGYALSNLEGNTWTRSDLRLEVTGKITPKTIWQHFKPHKPFPLHGQGLGAVLLRRTIQEAKARGCSKMVGNVSREDSLEWYQHFGFVVLETRGDFFAAQIVLKLER